MARGGDRRPITRSEGHELRFASLLAQAMCADTSEAGARFNSERDSLFQRWERLLHVLADFKVRGWGGPPSSLDRINDWLPSFLP
jgi:hypothetical protein